MKQQRISKTHLGVLLGMGGIAVACASNLPDISADQIVSGDGDGDTPGDGDNPGTGGNGNGIVDPGVPPDPALCQSSPLVRVDKIRPGGEDDPVGQAKLGAMTQDEKIAMLSGGTPCPDGDCDFDGTGVPSQNIKDFRMRDGPRGVHTHNGARATTFAVAMARGASYDLELENRVGRIQGIEARALRYDLSLSPQINVVRHPRWARTQESYSEDPLVLGKFGAAYVRGIQESLPACPKHYAANNTDENRETTVANMDEQTLREVYARTFQIVVEESDPGCIMAAYNGVNGEPMTANTHLLTEILRDDWQWEGLVVSDWWGPEPKDGATVLNAGLDLEMPDFKAFVSLPADLSAGDVKSERIDEAATRILNVRGAFGQLDEDYENTDATANFDIALTPEHQALARETSEKGAVLLKNDGILPIASTVKSIIIMGPDANVPHMDSTSEDGPHGMGDRGSSNTNPPYAISFFQGFKDRAGNAIQVTRPDLFEPPLDPMDPAAAAGFDLVIIPVSMQHLDEGEAFNRGGDRDDMTYSGAHPIHWNPKPTSFINSVALVNPNVIVINASGSAIIDNDWAASAKAIVQSFYPGQEGGNAIAGLFFGDINFSGKLPFTVANQESDYPIFGNNVANVTMDYLHGYRKFETEGLTPKYWLGHGLSYTTFTYSDIELLCEASSAEGAVNAKVTVTNSGTVAGDEVVMAFVGFPNTAVRRPVKELKAFTRTGLLEPGASKVIYFSIPVRDLRYWAEGSGWALENVAHDLIISGSANPADPNMKKASFSL